MDDLISKQAAIDAVRHSPIIEVQPAYMLIDKADVLKNIVMLPSARPNLQQTCNKLATDCISRQAAIDAVCRHGTELERRGITVLSVVNHKQATVDLLESLPSAQPEIVRCWECKWWELTPDNTMLPDWHRCRYYGARMHTRVEDFCSRGERNG